MTRTTRIQKGWHVLTDALQADSSSADSSDAAEPAGDASFGAAGGVDDSFSHGASGSEMSFDVDMG